MSEDTGGLLSPRCGDHNHRGLDQLKPEEDRGMVTTTANLSNHRKQYYVNLDSCDTAINDDKFFDSKEQPQVEYQNPEAARRKKQGHMGLGAMAGSAEGGKEKEDGEVVVDKVSRRLGIFGGLNVVYVVLQLWGSMAFGSLALLSDGFHNLSDVAAIGMAMYIHKLQRRKCGGDELPFGYKRAEVIGGLINSVALVSLSVYIVLTAIPRLIAPTEVAAGPLYVLLAFAGVVINLVGVVFFLHLHPSGLWGAHNHCQGHEHGMAADDKTAADDTDGRRLLADDEQGEIDTVGTNGDKASIIEITPLAGANKHKNTGSAGNKGAFLLGSGNNSAGARGAMASEGARDEEEGGEEDGWVGGVGEGARATAGLSLSCLDREHSHDQSQGSGLSHRRHSRLSGVECNGNHEPHHGGAVVGGDEGGGEGIGCHEHHSCIPHDHDSENGGHGHGHSHDHSHCKGDWTEDTSMNIWAVFVHAVADAVSSAIVCAQGAVTAFYGHPNRVDATDYLDPITSICLSIFIVCAAVPVIVECSHILLEGTPRKADVDRLRKDLAGVSGVSSVEWLSVIQLNSEERFVATVTLAVTPPARHTNAGANGRGKVLAAAKEVLAKHHIGHSTVEIMVVGEGVDGEVGGRSGGDGNVHLSSPLMYAGGVGGHEHGHNCGDRGEDDACYVRPGGGGGLWNGSRGDGGHGHGCNGHSHSDPSRDGHSHSHAHGHSTTEHAVVGTEERV